MRAAWFAGGVITAVGLGAAGALWWWLYRADPDPQS